MVKSLKVLYSPLVIDVRSLIPSASRRTCRVGSTSSRPPPNQAYAGSYIGLTSLILRPFPSRPVFEAHAFLLPIYARHLQIRTYCRYYHDLSGNRASVRCFATQL